MNAPSSTSTLRVRLTAGLAVACLALMAGCGNDLSQAEDAANATTEPTRTTEMTGTTGSTTTSTTTTEPSGGVDGGGNSSTSEPTGVTLPTGITLPDGTEITLPEGVDLTVPDGLGDCVEAGAALTELSLAALGVTSTEDIDKAADTLEQAFGSAASGDIDTVANVAREAADGSQPNFDAATSDAYTKALTNLTDRLSEVCGVG